MATVNLRISLKVDPGVDPRFVAFQALQQLANRAMDLQSWQEVNAPIGNRKIGECHFEITES